MRVKRFEEFINEDKDQVHEYGCVMLYFDFPEMNKIHDMIDSADVYTEGDGSSFGIETEPHVTLLYGLHSTVLDSSVKEALSSIEFSKCTLTNASLFENKFDVLKFDVSGESIYTANKELTKLPYTSDYPDYHPHMTISYLKKGTGSRYVKSLKSTEFKIKPSHIMYSKPNGDKIRMELK